MLNDVSWAAQTGKHFLRTQNVSEQNQKHFLCPQQMLRTRANGETFVSATMYPQQLSSFARALTHKLNRSVYGHEWKRNGKAQYCRLFLFKTKTDNRVSWVQNWSFLQSDEIIAVKNVYYRGLKSKLCFAYRNGC